MNQLPDRTPDSKTVLLTGANGFIGQKLLLRLAELDAINVIAVVRNPNELPIGDYRILGVPDYLQSDWHTELQNVDTVIHVAGIIRPPEHSKDPEAAMLQVNAEVTKRLAQAAVAQGVSQFIYLSSLSVFGEENNNRHLTPISPTAPGSIYAKSKLAGELAVEQAAAGSQMNCVTIRPPMVIGTGTKGTFYTMANLCAKLGFSPFGSIKTPFPIVFTETLVKFIIAAVALNPIDEGVYLVGESKIYNVQEIIDQIAALTGRKVRHVPVPGALLKLIMSILRKRHSFNQVTGGLRLDVTKSKAVLDRFEQISNA